MHSPDAIVWAMCQRKWYPAKVVDFTELTNVQKKQNNKSDTINVRWYHNGKIACVRTSCISELGVNQLDRKRAAFSEKIRLLYDQALFDLDVDL